MERRALPIARREMTRRRGAYARFLGLGLASMVVAVVALVVWVVYVFGIVDHAVLDISTDAVPSMVALGRARSELWTMETALAERLEGASGDERFQKERIALARHRIADFLEQYRVFSTFPGERELWPEIDDHLA